MKTINLTVPFFSQRDNNYIWHYKREKDEEFDGEMEIFCRIIYEEKDIASKLNSKLIVRTQGAKR